MAETWRESAGCTTDSDGYQSGDLTQTLWSPTFAKLQQWAIKPKQRNGYEFGDITAGIVRWLSDSNATPGEQGQGPTELSARQEVQETQKHGEEIAKRMTEQRQRALELLEKNIPLMKARLAELEARCLRATPATDGECVDHAENSSQLDAGELSSLLRLRGFYGVSPLLKYERALEDVKETSGSVIDGSFVQQLASLGHLQIVEKAYVDVVLIADECEACARDVGAVTSA